MRFHWLRVVQSCADVPEHRVDFVHHGMERSGLLLACDDKTLALMFKEILRHGVEPFFATRRWGRAVKGRAAELCCDIDNFCGQRKREELHFRSPQWQAMIRGCPGNARRRLDHIEPTPSVTG